ncbi:OstA-like protein [Segatella copri]|uniref:OstA-like protein n=1 Tax=Segatella copri TaxID=165179 RepID=UPI003F89C981
MINNKQHNINKNGHRIFFILILCLFGFCLVQAMQAPRKKHKKRPKGERVYLLHADELRYDMFGRNPDAQIVKGKVSFMHQGGHLTCDSAYFYQGTNSVKAFGHVHYRQGDTLSLTCERAEYDGMMQMMHARRNVVLHHRRQTLKTDSLDFDRLYNMANFFDGGTLIDGKDRLVSDWGEYHTETREAKFVFNVKLRSGKDVVTTDTLYYDVPTSTAHMVGPSKIVSGSSVVHTADGYYDTKIDKAKLFGRSTLVDKDKSITGDSLYYVKNGESTGYGNVVYVDKNNKNSLTCNYLRYNEKTGMGFATKRPVAIDYSQKDTLWMHSDTMRIYTFNINTDSVYRKVHAYPHVRAFRNDMQAICDSLVFNSKDSCMTMYKDPVIWNANRQMLGEEIRAYMADSTIRFAHVIGQALSIEQMPDSVHYNQITSSEMKSYFEKGEMKMTEAIGNVQTVYYMTNDKDSSLVGLNYLETDTMRMYLGAARKLDKIWTNKFTSTMYPITQVPPAKYKLPNFAWFEDLRPKDKNDIFVWRGKSSGTELKSIKRHEAPLQSLKKESLKKDKEKAEAETASGKTDKEASKTAPKKTVRAASRKISKVAPKVTKKNKRK